MKEVKKLIDLGKEKGYLTYDDVNDMLPAEVVSPDQIDDVMTIFGEMEIEVVDANQRVALGGASEELAEEDQCPGWCVAPSRQRRERSERP